MAVSAGSGTAVVHPLEISLSESSYTLKNWLPGVPVPRLVNVTEKPPRLCPAVMPEPAVYHST
jgi:hypothetical protein